MFAFDLFVDFKIVGANEGAALYLIKSRWWQPAVPNTIFMKMRFMPVTFKHSGGPCNLHNPFVQSAIGMMNGAIAFLSTPFLNLYDLL